MQQLIRGAFGDGAGDIQYVSKSEESLIWYVSCWPPCGEVGFYITIQNFVKDTYKILSTLK